MVGKGIIARRRHGSILCSFHIFDTHPASGVRLMIRYGGCPGTGQATPLCWLAGEQMHHAPISSSRRRGTVLWFSVITIAVLMAFVSFGVDLGRAQLAKTQMQRAVDAAARGGVAVL